jgi:hypothetical protein
MTWLYPGLPPSRRKADARVLHAALALRSSSTNPNRRPALSRTASLTASLSVGYQVATR